MKKQLIVAGFCLLSGTIFAQNEVDALRYSSVDVVGTARFQSLGGAFTALGVDMTSAATNPAGIAANRSSQFQFTPAIYGISASSNFAGNQTSDLKLNLNIGSWGFIGTFGNKWSKDPNKGIQSFSLGLTYTRLGNFHQNLFSENPNSSSSLMDSYLENLNRGNGTSTDVLNSQGSYLFNENLAYQTYLLNPDSVLADHYTSVVQSSGNTQSFRLETIGRIGETNFTFGTNVANKLHLGLGVGISRIRYTEKTTYSETDAKFAYNGFDNFSYARYLKTQGSGFNVKFGLIYRPSNWFRLGASAISPTIYQMADTYYNSMSSNLDTAQYIYNSPNGSYNYTLSTAPRFNGGLAFIIGKLGLITADYEFIYYPLARLSANDGYSFTTENQNTRNLYRPTGNIRMGTEWKIANMSIRAGAVLFGNPYKSGPSYFNRMNFSLGGGYMGKHLFFDVAYVFSTYKADYVFYDLNAGNGASAAIRNTSGNVLATFGIKF
ncbi:MAG: hypothetical protein K1X82_13270 [Bacteroidia bacterium]|nr:hypothetical protein [Bacteroidia bacterium]